MSTLASSAATVAINTQGKSNFALVRAVFEWVALCNRIPHSLIALLARFSIAAVFWNSGQTKVKNFALISADALSTLRADMLRFARLQLRNAETAEDLVQESIEAALCKATSFTGQSSLKTWVFAILRNRIIDHLRQSSRTVNMSSLVEDGEDWQERLEAYFNERGHWRAELRPVAWPNPDESMQTQQFWLVFETCLEHLPAATGRVFMMRKFLGFEADEICAQLGITTSNCHVILHRARLKLRGCMETGWGRSEGAKC